MAFKIRNVRLITTLPYAASAHLNRWAYADTDTLAAMLTAGYFNDLRARAKVGDLMEITALADTAAPESTLIRFASVPASGNVLVVTDDDQATVGSARAVVPSADGLTTGLLLASDQFVTLASANAAHIVTLPAIADVPLGKVIWMKNGATACELRTPATSGTKINNGAADANEAVIAANVAVFAKKVAADDWLVVTYTGGAVAAPIPDA